MEVESRKKLLLNFSSVDFLSSAALGKLITLDKKVKANSGALKLSNVRPEIYEVFAITKLNRLFDIKSDEAECAGGVLRSIMAIFRVVLTGMGDSRGGSSPLLIAVRQAWHALTVDAGQ